MKTFACLLFVLAGAARGAEELVPPPMPAPPPPPTSAVVSGQAWSIVGARTAGQGANVLEAGVGWPGLHVGYLRGLAPTLDVGVRGSFVYGLEGMVTQVLPGMKLQALLKVNVLDTNRVSLGLVAEPGPLFAFDRFGNTLAGFSVPVGVRLGIAAASAVGIGVSFDVPLWVRFGGGGGVYVPLLTGIGVEYFVRSDLGVYFRTKMGPTILPNGFAAFTFDATFGLGWKF